VKFSLALPIPGAGFSFGAGPAATAAEVVAALLVFAVGFAAVDDPIHVCTELVLCATACVTFFIEAVALLGIRIAFRVCSACPAGAAAVIRAAELVVAIRGAADLLPILFDADVRHSTAGVAALKRQAYAGSLLAFTQDRTTAATSVAGIVAALLAFAVGFARNLDTLSVLASRPFCARGHTLLLDALELHTVEALSALSARAPFTVVTAFLPFAWGRHIHAVGIRTRAADTSAAVVRVALLALAIGRADFRCCVHRLVPAVRSVIRARAARAAKQA